MIKRISRRTKHRHTPRRRLGQLDRLLRLQRGFVELRSRQEGLTLAMESAHDAALALGYAVHTLKRARP